MSAFPTSFNIFSCTYVHVWPSLLLSAQVHTDCSKGIMKGFETHSSLHDSDNECDLYAEKLLSVPSMFELAH